jgi:hypothetical protein
MNFLRLKSEALARFRVKHSQYWLDMLVNQLLREQQREIAITGTVLAVLRDPRLGLELITRGVNIVTNDGDQYYAQMACGESPTDDFDGASAGLRLGDDATAPTKSDTDVTSFLADSAHALDATYEKTNDDDPANLDAGVDVVTWRFSYTTGEGNVSGIVEGAVVDDRTTPTAALSHFLFEASFDKTSSDTLKVFLNHTMNGV